MNKYLKVIVCIIVVVIVSVIIDFICIFTIIRPLFAIKYIISDTTGNVYKGLFYDTYNCMEYSMPQVKFKGTKFNCSYIITALPVRVNSNLKGCCYVCIIARG